VTEQLTLSADQVRQHMRGNGSPILGEMVEAWFGASESITFHDPLAAATIFEPELCRFERGAVEVEVASEPLQGLTRWAPGAADSRHEVAMQVDGTAFFEHYFGVITPAPPPRPGVAPA
jgi:inosine-uridine nucleoside N-ribohydrolase